MPGEMVEVWRWGSDDEVEEDREGGREFKSGAILELELRLCFGSDLQGLRGGERMEGRKRTRKGSSFSVCSVGFRVASAGLQPAGNIPAWRSLVPAAATRPQFHGLSRVCLSLEGSSVRRYVLIS